MNKIAYRLQVDSRFSFAFAERLNIQTERVAGARPDQIGDYLQNAGDVALKGTNEMMSAFFDGVDTYLDATEQSLTAMASPTSLSYG